jgi:glycosyltransferase involved in cell wall biosynthesis
MLSPFGSGSILVLAKSPAGGEGELFRHKCIYTGSMAKYSIVVPFHNEEENVTALYARLKQAMEQVADSFEMVFVDDGSSDRSYKMLEEIAAVDSRVLVVKLRRNFGQTSALAAGFDHASGEFILAMDGDLQHDPNDIPAFLEKLEEGYDVVSGWRKHRADSFVMRRVPSRCANWLPNFPAWTSTISGQRSRRTGAR